MNDSPVPRISVVTPSFNQAAFLEKTLESVLAQQYPALEYLVMDGGSTDGSVAVLRRYAPRLAYWISEPDRGQAEAINRGWARATGEILAWLNSDDQYLPDTLATVGEYFAQHPETVMVYGHSRLLDEQGAVIGQRISRPMALPDVLRWFDRIPQPTAFIRRSALAQTGFLDTNLRSAMDYDLWLRLARQFPLTHLPVFLAQEHVHPAAKTQADPHTSIWEAADCVERFFQQPLPPAVANLRSSALAAHELRKAHCQFDAGQRREGSQHLRQAFQLDPRLVLCRRGLTGLLKAVRPAAAR